MILSWVVPYSFLFMLSRNWNGNQLDSVSGWPRPVSYRFIWILIKKWIWFYTRLPKPNFLPFSVEIWREINQILSEVAPNQFLFILNWNLNRNQLQSVSGCPMPMSLRFELKFEWKLMTFCPGLSQTHFLSVWIEIGIEINQVLFQATPRPIPFHFQLKFERKSIKFSAGLP